MSSSSYPLPFSPPPYPPPRPLGQGWETVGRAPGPARVLHPVFMSTPALGLQPELREPRPQKALWVAWETARARSKAAAKAQSRVVGPAASMDAFGGGSGAPGRRPKQCRSTPEQPQAGLRGSPRDRGMRRARAQSGTGLLRRPRGPSPGSCLSGPRTAVGVLRGVQAVDTRVPGPRPLVSHMSTLP